MFTDDEWVVAIIVFLILVILSAVLIAIRMRPRFKIGETDSDPDNKGVDVNSNKKQFDDALFIEEDLKLWLEEHYKQIIPVLRIWQKRAWHYGWFHYYAVFWTTIVALSIPYLVTYIDGSSKAGLLVQIMAAFAAIIYGLHSVFKSQTNFQRYRLHESAVYTTVRCMKYDPDSFGKSSEERRITYATEIENIRNQARADEIDNTPSPSSPPSGRS